jgi:ribosome-binding factor A
MAKGYSRSQQVADLVQTELARILQRDAKNLIPAWVTITGVEMSPDLAFAKIFVSVLEETKSSEAVAALNSSSKHLRYTLAQAVNLRIVPELKFIYDDSTVRGSRISSLINDALKNSKD